MKINLDKLAPYIEKKLVSVQSHPLYPLFIYNYTQHCQFSGEWDEITLMCRGMILDAEGNVIARPYDKFFNREEKPEQVPNCDFQAYDKADGSLGIMYKINGERYLATRGSFDSEQAIEGTKMLRELDYEFRDGLTYLFEIIYPENRIVVDYGKERKLIFLGARDIDSGNIYTPDFFPDYPYETVKEIKDFEKPRDNAEGVVLYFSNGFMCKVKYEEYVRLHRLVTGVNARRIWDLLRTGESINTLLDKVPEEFAEWVKTTAKKLRYEYEVIEVIGQHLVDEYSALPTRKDIASAIINEDKDHSGIAFRMLDGKPYEESIWRMIKPEHEKPFRQDL